MITASAIRAAIVKANTLTDLRERLFCMLDDLDAPETLRSGPPLSDREAHDSAPVVDAVEGDGP